MKLPHPFKRLKAKVDAEFEQPDPDFEAVQQRVRRAQARQRQQFAEFQRRYPRDRYKRYRSGSRPTPS
jgi:hypothetical protein